jgi:predicted nucleic acid-binding protein
MNYVLDTNILLIFLREKQLANYIENKYNPLTFPNIPIISVVTVGELKSIAIQNNWSEQRIKRLDEFVSQFLIADINVKTVIKKYSEIDAFSQGRLKGKPLLTSARNMGKNDLWIAATTSVLDATLMTTDKDFNHLDNQFLKLIYIDIAKPIE